MEKTVETKVPNIYVSDLERLTQKIHQVTGEEDAEVSFEFIIASLFPTSWQNIQGELNHQYTCGYIQGRLDKEREMYQKAREDGEADCYCE